MDFLIKDKLTWDVVELQVKASFGSSRHTRGTAQFDIRMRTFNEMSGGFVLAAMIDPTDAVWLGWLIPAVELPGISRVARGYHIITPNPSEVSRDCYARWQVQTMKQVVERLTS